MFTDSNDVDFPLATEVFDVEDVILSIANLREYREQVSKGSRLYEFNIIL
jgi:hypothetical protein